MESSGKENSGVTTTEAIVVLVTAANPREAGDLARHLLSEKLAACVNMVSGITSLFWWEDKIDEAEETLLVIKSAARLFPQIEAAVKEKHSYSVPEILALPIEKGYAGYLEWIEKNVKP